jgi:hypothetical protein
MAESTTLSTRTRPSPRLIRRLFVQRWLQLLDDAEHLVSWLEDAPPGTFDEEEGEDVALTLSRVCDLLVSHRPFLPQSRDRAPGARQPNPRRS